jgi:AAA15 family ATPase/GTPase
MIVEFSVTNFKCFRKKTTISFIANTQVEGADIKPETLIEVNKFGIDYLVKSIVIYGANASGKSSFLQGFQMFTDLLLASVTGSIGIATAGYYKNFTFLLDEEQKNKPIEFEIIFIKNKRLFKYGFSFNAKGIVHEILEEQKDKESEVIYSRNANGDFKGFEDYQNEVEPDKLFIGRLKLANKEEGRLFYNYFTVENIHQLTNQHTFNKLSEGDENFKKWFLENMKYTDKIIKDFELKKDLMPFVNYDLTSRLASSQDAEVGKILMQRRNKMENIVSFEDFLESEGTKKMIRILGLYYDFWNGNHLCFEDEIDKSLHPLLLKHLFETFFAFKNEKGEKSTAQLLATTHDVSLLDANIFRKDQIWFTEKDEDTGESKLYSLSHFIFNNETKPKNLLEEYLFGRFGAVPKI